MSETEADYSRRLESEKARAIIWFAILAIIATVRVGAHEGDFWNFPCNSPCIHITLLVVPLLTNWIYLWLGYAGCMLVYFSEDWFQRFERGRAFREVMRRVGNRVFLYFYPLTIAFFTGFSETSFLLPLWIQSLYWYLVAVLLGLLMIWTMEGVIGRRVFAKKGILTHPLEIFFELLKEGFEAFGEGWIHAGKKLRARITHKTPTPVRRGSGRPVTRVFLIALVIGEGVLTWLISRPSFLDILTVVTVTLYLFALLATIIGFLVTRDREPESRSTP